VPILASVLVLSLVVAAIFYRGPVFKAFDAFARFLSGKPRVQPVRRVQVAGRDHVCIFSDRSLFCDSCGRLEADPMAKR